MIRLDIMDLPIYAIEGTMTREERSSEFLRAVFYRELVNAWNKHNVPDVNSNDPADTANKLLKMYELVWNKKDFQYEIKLKENV